MTNVTYKDRFCEIRYFFDQKEGNGRRESATKMFHGRWFEHGSRTILGEAASPQDLFMMDICDENPVVTIIQKVQIQLIEDGKAPVEVASPDVGSSSFNLRSVCLDGKDGF